jgi:hypothetical protein
MRGVVSHGNASTIGQPVQTTVGASVTSLILDGEHGEIRTGQVRDRGPGDQHPPPAWPDE